MYRENEADKQGRRSTRHSNYRVHDMIHFTCDRCKRVLDHEEDLRYVVKIEACAAMEACDVDDPEDDRDHLLEIHEILERSDLESGNCVGDDIYQKMRFDLCPECYRKFARNPLGREFLSHLGFSQN